MREQLRPWLDRPVFMTGTVARHVQRGGPTSLFDVMLEGVEVRLVDRTRPLVHPDAEVVTLDHLWLIEPPRIFDLGTRTMAMGRPGFYARANGTVDIGVHQILASDADSFLETVQRNMPTLPRRQRLAAMEFVLKQLTEAADDNALIYVSSTQSVDGMLDALRAGVASVRRSRETENRAALSSWAVRQARLNGQHTTRRQRRQAERQCAQGRPAFLPTLAPAI